MSLIRDILGARVAAKTIHDLQAENGDLHTRIAEHEQELAQARRDAAWTALYYESNQRENCGTFETGVIPKTARRLYRIAEGAPAGTRTEIRKLIGELKSPATARSRRITADALDASIKNGQFKGDDSLRAKTLAWIAEVRNEQNRSY